MNDQWLTLFRRRRQYSRQLAKWKCGLGDSPMTFARTYTWAAARKRDEWQLSRLRYAVRSRVTVRGETRVIYLQKQAATPSCTQEDAIARLQRETASFSIRG